jgi:TRAP-type C4-dicarboxylate transport system permease small subunit
MPGAHPDGEGRLGLDTIRRLIERPAGWLIAGASVVTVVMMFHIVADVFAKYAFNSPIEGTIETVAGYYMVAVVFFPFAYVACTEGHIIVELFTRGMSKRKLMRLDGIIAIATFLYMAVFTWKTVEEAILRTEQLEIWETGTSMIPIWPSRWLIPIGCGVMAVYVVYRLVRDLRGQSDQ